jgi:hypothetical protein
MQGLPFLLSTCRDQDLRYRRAPAYYAGGRERLTKMPPWRHTDKESVVPDGQLIDRNRTTSPEPRFVSACHKTTNN